MNFIQIIFITCDICTAIITYPIKRKNQSTTKNSDIFTETEIDVDEFGYKFEMSLINSRVIIISLK